VRVRHESRIASIAVVISVSSSDVRTRQTQARDPVNDDPQEIGKPRHFCTQVARECIEEVLRQLLGSVGRPIRILVTRIVAHEPVHAFTRLDALVFLIEYA